MFLWVRARRKRPDEMYQIPEVFVRFHFPECGHATHADTVLRNPEEFPVRIILDLDRTYIRCALIHPSPRIRWPSSVIALALRAFRAEEFVPCRVSCLNVS